MSTPEGPNSGETEKNVASGGEKAERALSPEPTVAANEPYPYEEYYYSSIFDN